MILARTACAAVVTAFVCCGTSAFGVENPPAHHAATTRHADAPPKTSAARTSHARHGKAATKAPAKHVKKRLIRRDPPNASWAKYRREPWRRGYVSVVGHGKQWSGYLVDASGDVPPVARKEVSAALASWRTGKTMLIDERLMALVADVSDEFGGRPIRIVSGYREQSYAPDSKHKVGQAFDFSIPGVPNGVLKDYLRSLPDVGVGYYPNSTHVHLDVRDKPTFWVDYSAPGEHPQYAYDRRVAGFTAAERSVAAALDAIGASSAASLSSPAHGSVPMMRAVAAPATTRATAAFDSEDAGDDEREPAAGDSGSDADAAAARPSPPDRDAVTSR